MMQRRTLPLMGALLIVLSLLAVPWSARAQEPVTSRLKMSIGGFIKPEFIYHSTRAGGATGFVAGSLAVIPQKNTLAGDNGMFMADAMESRFNFTLTAPDWRGLKSTGFFEFDWFGDTPSAFRGGANGAVAGSSAGQAQLTIFQGVPRIRHAFFRLEGEGLGGTWQLLVGQFWGLFDQQPYYYGTTFSFAGASAMFARVPQIRLTHSFRFLKDFQLENAASVSSSGTMFGEVPDGTIGSRLFYHGWQGWQGGVRTPLNLGISALVGRIKADVQAGGAVAGGASAGSRSISNTRWGLTGGIFLPILPGTSATDRTWALSLVGEGGYGEGIADYIVGADPMASIGPLQLNLANVGAERGQAFFNPGKCTGGPLVPGVVPVAAASGAAGACPAGFVPTELSLFKVATVAVTGQLYLPWNFWVSGGWRSLWYTNADNATAQTSVRGPAGTIVFSPGGINQGQFAAVGPVAGVTTSTALFGGRDALLKRQWNAFGALFWDMTPNIRWGFEYAYMGTNRRNADQSNTDHRLQFGAYYFF